MINGAPNHERQTETVNGIGLTYARLSYSPNPKTDVSPAKQRERNTYMCEQLGLIEECYEDVDGHKSGRFVDNRPGWLLLERRLSDPDVKALIAHDLSRVHRKGWRIGKLLDELDSYDVKLILSDPVRTVDTSTPMGRMFVQWMAMADEYYAEDLAIRARSSIARRKEQGVTVGPPAYGTVRDDDGFLVPRIDGVWLLKNGKWIVGICSDIPPDEAVQWRGVFQSVTRVLELYSTNKYGYGNLAHEMNKDSSF